MGYTQDWYEDFTDGGVFDGSAWSVSANGVIRSTTTAQDGARACNAYSTDANLMSAARDLSYATPNAKFTGYSWLRDSVNNSAATGRIAIYNSSGDILAYLFFENDGSDLHGSIFYGDGASGWTSQVLESSLPDETYFAWEIIADSATNTISATINGESATSLAPYNTIDDVKTIKIETVNVISYDFLCDAITAYAEWLTISGTLKENESDADGSQYDYAVIKPDFTTPAFTVIDADESGATGAVAVDVAPPSARHFLLMLDSTGTYLPKIFDQLLPEDSAAPEETSFTPPSYVTGSDTYSGRATALSDDGGMDGYYAVAFHYPLRDITDFCYATHDICDASGDFDFSSLATGIYIGVLIDPDGTYYPYAWEFEIS